MRRRLLLLIPAIWFVALLSAPAIAYVAGDRQPLLENRPKEPFPPINRSSLKSAQVFKRIDQALLDRLPLRGDALNLKASIALRWFGVSPSPEVLPGKSNWLYMWRDFRPCQPADLATNIDPADSVEIIARVTGASGRRVGVLVAGSKSATEPQHFRDAADRAQASCVAKREAHVRERLRDTPGGLDITPALDQQLAQGHDVFLQRDTHWQGNAQLLFVQAMLDAAKPGLAKEVGLRQVGTPIRREADLTRMVGLPQDQDTHPPIATHPVTYPDATPNETMLIGDSQMRLAMTDQLVGRPPISTAALPGPFYCERSLFNTGACTKQLAESRTVLFEWVARDMLDTATACIFFPEMFLPDLEKRLTPHSVGLVSSANGRAIAKPLDLGSTPTTIGFAPSTGNVAPALRLMVIPVERLGTPQPGGPQTVMLDQNPTDGKLRVPCASLTAGAGGAVIMPIPAGRDATKFALSLTAPPGTRLGKPVSYLLDDAAVESGMQAALRP